MTPLPGHQIQFSNEYKDLTNRERDLRAITAAGQTDAAELREMWQALADDYTAESQHVAAERCQKQADMVGR